ncbi:MAG: exonuclease domain-containing protein [Bacilli bacterium]|nr:exonuclease domain-containing protein [Bacilli bacterium]
MKDLEKALKGFRVLAFIDLEGTQFSHEMIEIGAYKVYLKDDLTVKKVMKPYKTYVRAKSRIGHFVTELTGITEQMLKDKGVVYRLALQGFKKYMGKDFEKALFVTFGSHDKVIFQSSLENNLDASKEDTLFILRHHFDFSAFLSRYIKDEHGNPYSLANYLKIFEVEFEGKAHDACADAENLVSLYEAFLKKKDIVKAEYKKTVARMHHFPAPLLKVAQALNEGKTVTPEEYDAYFDEVLK